MPLTPVRDDACGRNFVLRASGLRDEAAACLASERSVAPRSRALPDALRGGAGSRGAVPPGQGSAPLASTACRRCGPPRARTRTARGARRDREGGEEALGAG